MSFSLLTPHHRRNTCSQKANHRLWCEPLEDRLCLTVITFESLPASGQPGGTFFPSTSFSIDGFDVGVRGSLPTEVHAPGHCSPDCPENGGQYLRTQVNGVLTFTEENNRAFTLHSLQVAESFKGIASFWAAQIDIKGILPNGNAVVTSVNVDGIQDGFGPMDDFQTFLLPDEFEEILAFQLSGSGGFSRNDFSIDNVEVSILSDDSDPPTDGPDAPVQAIAALIAEVDDLNLHRGIEKSLVKKLAGAQDKLDDGNSKNDNAAIGKMNAFTRHVQAQSGKKINADEATDLISEAELIIESLEADRGRPGLRNRH